MAPETPTSTQTNGQAGASLRRALSERRLEARFQPIVDLRRGEIAAYECLTRPGEDSGFESPIEFFNAAEREGMLWDVEEVTRALSFEGASTWPEGVLLFMNCSPQVVADQRLIGSLKAGLARAGGLSASRVVIEITERSDEQADVAIVEQVQALRDAGFQVAIDDVGAGTSGLTRIMSIRPSWLKVDRELVEGIDSDRAKQNLLRFLLHFARLSGVRLVAEGIERQEELSTLLSIGVPFGQGYLLGRPGGHDQQLDPLMRERIRGGWAGASGTRYRDPRAIAISLFARESLESQGEDRVCDIAGELLRKRDEAGVIVMEGRDLLGWVSREAVLRAASDQRAEMAMRTLPRMAKTSVHADATVVEVLEVAAAREPSAAGDPIIVLDGDRVRGTVSVGQLLNAAADVCRLAQHRTSATTGLPGRVRCDEHVVSLIEHPGENGSRMAPGPDAAFIDIRNLSAYNGAFGFELGDELIQSLAGVLSAVAPSAGRSGFLGHLGDDRFLLVAAPGRLRSLIARVSDGFERSLRHSSAALEGDPEASGGLGLRVLVSRDPFRRVDTPREFYRIERRLRDLAQAVGTDSHEAVQVIEEPPVLGISRAA